MTESRGQDAGGQSKQSDETRPSPLGEVLIALGKVTETQLDQALTTQKSRGGLTGQILVRMGAATLQDVKEGLAKQAGMEWIDLPSTEIQTDAVRRMAAHVARAYSVLPIRYEQDILTVVMAEPLNAKALNELCTLTKCDIRGVAAKEDDVLAAQAKCYPM